MKEDIINKTIAYICNLHYEENRKLPLGNFANIVYDKNNLDEQAVDRKLEILKKYGIKDKTALNLLDSMPYILLLSDSDFKRKVGFIFNANQLYAVVCCFHNTYSWATYNPNLDSFVSFELRDFDSKTVSNEENAIIRMVFDSTSRKDIEKAADIKTNDELEEKIYKLKQLKTNPSGYHIL